MDIRMESACRLLTAILLLKLWALPVFAEDWPQFRGVNRDGHSQTKGIPGDWNQRPPQLLRELQGAGQGYASLCVVGSRIYTTGNSDSSQFAVAIDWLNDEVRWKTELVDVLPNHAVAGSRSTPTYDDGRLYVTSSDGQLFCLDAEQGQIVWRKSFQEDFGGRLMSGWGFAESPLVDGDQVVVTPGGSEAMIVALNKLTGELIWRSKLDETAPTRNMSRIPLKAGAGYASMIKAPLGSDRSQYIQFVGQGLVGIDPRNGDVLWQHSASASRVTNICSPVVSPTGVIAYSAAPQGGLSLISLDGLPARIRIRGVGSFRPQNLQCHHGGMVQHEGYLYFGAGENQGFPTCLELDTGTIRWGGTFRGPGIGSAAVVLVDGKLIFRYQNGVVALIAANPSRYQPLGKFTQSVPSNNTSWSHPVVVDQKLLLREQDTIMIYNLGTQQ